MCACVGVLDVVVSRFGSVTRGASRACEGFRGQEEVKRSGNGVPVSKGGGGLIFCAPSEGEAGASPLGDAISVGALTVIGRSKSITGIIQAYIWNTPF